MHFDLVEYIYTSSDNHRPRGQVRELLRYVLLAIADGSTTYAEYLVQNSPQNWLRCVYRYANWSMSGSYRSESQYNAPTTEADLGTQTGKEESCALKEKNTKLAYSAKRIHRNG